MAYLSHQASDGTVWDLAARQHGVVSMEQLIGFGLSRSAIRHRIARGRLHPVMRGVYAVGRPELTRRGQWMAAALCCGQGTRGPVAAALSHRSAAALWGFGTEVKAAMEVSIRSTSLLRRPGIRVHRRTGLKGGDVTACDGIPVTTPGRTLVDLGTQLGPAEIERAVIDADKLDLVSADALRASLERYRGQPGVARLRAVLDRRTFRLTDSELERRFLALVDSTGLPRPLTAQRVNGYRVDFYWPDLGLVVETDGLRYHRTPGQQGRDRLRDQAHSAAGLTQLRFTHEQIRHQPGHVRRVLKAVVDRLAHEPSRVGTAEAASRCR